MATTKFQPRNGKARRIDSESAERMVMGFTLGVLGTFCATLLGLFDPIFRPHPLWLLPVGGIVGALCGIRPVTRRAHLAAVGILVAALLVIGLTPVTEAFSKLVQADALQRCDAAVPLAAGLYPDGGLTGPSLDRVLEAMELAREGYAPRLILTRLPPPLPSSRPAVERLEKRLSISLPLAEVGPVDSTHDEAVKVAAFASRHGWHRILLVTSPFHTRRAKADFEHAGLIVVVRPCAIHSYNVQHPSGIESRLMAFREGLRELVGWQLYRWRRWI